MTDKGLSYLRILAVEAGIALADTASAGQDKAKAMQEELSAKGFLEDAHFPTFVEEFPEGIKASEFRTHYGGEKGPRHLRMMHDVEQAVKKCPAYR
jgi:hypothetical protein